MSARRWSPVAHARTNVPLVRDLSATGVPVAVVPGAQHEYG